MPTTFRTHFDDDITRAQNILAHSRAMDDAGEPERLYKDLRQMLPEGEILKSTRQHRPLWRVRMAARKVMEKDNLLSLSRLEEIVLTASFQITKNFGSISSQCSQRMIS